MKFRYQPLSFQRELLARLGKATLPPPDPRVHRPGSIEDFKRIISGRR